MRIGPFQLTVKFCLPATGKCVHHGTARAMGLWMPGVKPVYRNLRHWFSLS